MEKINYKLPAKAVKIIEDLAKTELFSANYYLYLSLCCTNGGYFNAARYFAKEASEETKHFNTLCEILQARGIEPEVPKVDAPEIDFTDLKSGIKSTYLFMIEVTEQYDESIREMCEIDMVAYNALLPFLDIQMKALNYYNDAWTLFGDLDVEAQKEQDQLYFGENQESPKVA